MNLPQFKLLNIEDFTPEQQDLVSKLSLSLNIGIQNLYIALSNRLTFSDNFQITQKTFNVTVDAKGNPTSQTSFKLNSINNTIPKAIGSLVINAVSSETGVYPTGGVFVSFTQNNDNIVINNVTGLPSNSQFSLTLVVFT